VLVHMRLANAAMRTRWIVSNASVTCTFCRHQDARVAVVTQAVRRNGGRSTELDSMAADVQMHTFWWLTRPRFSDDDLGMCLVRKPPDLPLPLTAD